MGTSYFLVAWYSFVLSPGYIPWCLRNSILPDSWDLAYHWHKNIYGFGNNAFAFRQSRQQWKTNINQKLLIIVFKTIRFAKRQKIIDISSPLILVFESDISRKANKLSENYLKSKAIYFQNWMNIINKYKFFLSVWTTLKTNKRLMNIKITALSIKTLINGCNK